MSNAHGLLVSGTFLASKEYLSMFDFLIANSGKELHNNLQNAYEVGIPVIYTLGSNPYDMAQKRALDPDSWQCIQGESDDLDKAIVDMFVGGWSMTAMRAIHGFMVDVSVYDRAKKTNGEWLVDYAKWLKENAIVSCGARAVLP